MARCLVAEVDGVLSQVPEHISHLDFGVLTDARAGVSQVDLEAFRPSMVRQPKVPFPTVNDIEAMSSQESAERFQWFFSVFLCIFFVVLLVGTTIMKLLPLCLGGGTGGSTDYVQTARDAEAAEGLESTDNKPSGLDEDQQRLLVSLAFGITAICSFGACLFSLFTQRLSKHTGLDWEVYALLLAALGTGLLLQAVAAVSSGLTLPRQPGWPWLPSFPTHLIL